MEELENTPIPEKNNTKKTVLKTIIAILIVVLLATLTAFLVSHFCFTTFVVEGISMNPTLDGGISGEPLDGEKLIINKVGKIKRGDIVVFTPTNWSGFDGNKSLVKRVIAVSGDTIEIKDNKVILNGNVLDEPYINQGTAMADMKKITIQENQYFCMGDNRNHSTDSREHGCVQKDDMVGRCWLIKDRNNKLRHA